MINLKNLSVNDEILIYVNTTDPDIPYDSNLFLFAFKGGFTNTWTFVNPNIVFQNTRYTKFSIELVPVGYEDPENGIISLSPEGNFDYKLWAIDELTLDPAFGYELDAGQAFLMNDIAEMTPVTFISDNEAEKNIVYLTRNESVCNKWNTDPDQWNIAVQIWNECN